MDMTLIYALAALASGGATLLAWAAKLWWGKEFSQAKDETIKAKDAQIAVLNQQLDGLRELTPMKIREYFTSVRAQLEEYNDTLKAKLEEARSEVENKNREIDELQSDGTKKTSEIQKLENERGDIEKKAKKLEGQLHQLRDKYEGNDVITFQLPRIDPKIFEQLNFSYEALKGSLALPDINSDFSYLSKNLKDSMTTLNYDQAIDAVFKKKTSDKKET